MKLYATTLLVALAAGPALALPRWMPRDNIASASNGPALYEGYTIDETTSVPPSLQSKLLNLTPQHVQKGTVTEDEIRRIIEAVQNGEGLAARGFKDKTNDKFGMKKKEQTTVTVPASAVPSSGVSVIPTSNVVTVVEPGTSSTVLLANSINPAILIATSSSAPVPKSTFTPADMSGQGPFVNEPSIFGSTSGKSFSIDGPFKSFRVYAGDIGLRGIKVVDVHGNETVFGDASKSSLSDSPHDFDMDEDEKVVECHVQIKNNIVGGFHFSTNKGNKYNATSAAVKKDKKSWFHRSWEPTDIDVGSGMFGRFHGTVGTIAGETSSSAITGFGVEFIDDIRDIKMVSVDYAGFSPVGEMSALDGQKLIAGSQVLDNRNSSIIQSFTLATRKDIYITYSFTLSVAAMVGNTITASVGIEIPEIAKADTSTSFTWSLTATASTTLTKMDVVSQGANFNLACPAHKFCEGDAVFFTYSIDTNFVGNFQLTTKKGKTLTWQQSGTYKGSDLSDMRLVVNEFDTPPSGA